MSIEPLEDAIRILRTQDALAAALGIRSASISGWRKRGKVPSERCREIETLTGVSCHRLRPDVFGPARDSEPTPTASPHEVSHAA